MSKIAKIEPNRGVWAPKEFSKLLTKQHQQCKKDEITQIEGIIGFLKFKI